MCHLYHRNISPLPISWEVLIFIDYHWLSLITNGYHWLSLTIIDYLKTVNCWLTDSVTTWNQEMLVRLKGNQKTENFRLTQIWGQCGSCALLVGQLSQWRNRGRLHNGPTLSLPFSSSAVFLPAENILFAFLQEIYKG